MTKRLGFTLAEVLITLGIIGVVAAMTIPTLVADYNTRTWNTGSSVFEKKLTEALKVMNSQQVLAGHTTTKAFVEELSKHFKINKICDNNELSTCFSDNALWEIVNLSSGSSSEVIDLSTITNAQDLTSKDWSSEVIGVQFANGTSGLIAYNNIDCYQDPYSNQVKGTGCLSIMYDVNGFKSPNTTGKDIRGINAKISNCSFKNNGTCYSTPFEPEAHVWNACDNNGRTTDPEDLAIMSKYGINYCRKPLQTQVPNPYDYWAGAVIACGGVNKMASQAELLSIASSLYPSITVNTTGSSLCPKDANNNTIQCRQSDLAEKIGLVKDPADYFVDVWASEEASTGSAYYRNFYPYSTTQGTNGRQAGSQIMAICKQ